MRLYRYLVHKCTIQRYSESRGTAGEVIPTWSDVATGADCRLVVDTQDQPIEASSAQVQTVYTLYLPAGADIQEGDRIVDVLLEDASTEAGPFVVQAVIPVRCRNKLSHYRLRLERIE